MIQDSMGNKLFINTIGHVIIELISNAKKLDIGVLTNTPEGKVLSIKRKLSHVFKKNDSWGLNYSVIDVFLKDMDVVRIYCAGENKNYMLTVKDIREKGEFLWFKNEGFEKQIFVPRNLWLSHIPNQIMDSKAGGVLEMRML